MIAAYNACSLIEFYQIVPHCNRKEKNNYKKY